MTLVPLLVLSSAHAAEGISLTEALVGAMQHDADLLAAQAGVEAASADVLSATGAFDPTLAASAGAEHAESRSYLAGYPVSSSTSVWSADAGLSGELVSGTSWSVSTELARQSGATDASLGGVPSEQQTDYWASFAGVTVRQDVLAVLRPTAARQAVRRAAERADQAEMAALEARQAAFADIAEAWWSWKAATDRATLAEHAVEVGVALERVTEAWVREGQAEPVELARVRTERLSAEQDAAQARAAAVTAGDEVLLGMGREPGVEVTPQGDGAPRQLMDREVRSHLAAARAQSPAIRQLDLALDAARSAAGDVRHDGLPSLALTGSAGLTTFETTASGALLDLAGADAMPTWTTGVELSLPLGGRVARGTQEKARVEVRSAEIALASAERTLAGDVRSALRQLETAETSLSLATERLAVARQVEDGERARAEEGLRRLDQLLDAVNDREQAEQDVLDARLDSWRATVEVARLEGSVDAVLAH